MSNLLLTRLSKAAAIGGMERLSWTVERACARDGEALPTAPDQPLLKRSAGRIGDSVQRA